MKKNLLTLLTSSVFKPSLSQAPKNTYLNFRKLKCTFGLSENFEKFGRPRTEFLPFSAPQAKILGNLEDP